MGAAASKTNKQTNKQTKYSNGIELYSEYFVSFLGYKSNIQP